MKLLAIGVLAAAAACLVAVAVGKSRITTDTVCITPKTFLQKDGNAVMDQVDRFLERNLPSQNPVYAAKDLAGADWQVAGIESKSPGRVVFTAIVGEDWTMFGPLAGASYKVVLVRECRDGGWRVTRFEKDVAAGRTGPSSKS